MGVMSYEWPLVPRQYPFFQSFHLFVKKEKILITMFKASIYGHLVLWGYVLSYFFKFRKSGTKDYNE